MIESVGDLEVSKFSTVLTSKVPMFFWPEKKTVNIGNFSSTFRLKNIEPVVLCLETVSQNPFF